MLHREASSVLADAFELYANAYERSLLLKDFYGKEATLGSVTVGSDEDKIQKLESTYRLNPWVPEYTAMQRVN